MESASAKSYRYIRFQPNVINLVWLFNLQTDRHIDRFSEGLTFNMTSSKNIKGSVNVP